MSQSGNLGRRVNPLLVVFGFSLVFFVLLMAAARMKVFKNSGEHTSNSTSSKALFSKSSKSRVGILELTGVILDSKRLLRDIKDIEENDNIKAVVLRLNSPGGAVAPSQEIYEAIKRLDTKKPVIASMGSVAASGAYYIAMGARKVFANPGTMTGSIGVIMEFANLKDLYKWAKVDRYAIKTGKFKDVGADYREMSVDEKALLQELVDDVLGQFKQAVVQGRKLNLEAVTKVADGRIFTGAQAKRLGLIDELGTIQDATREAALQGKLDPDKVETSYPERHGKFKIMDFILDRGGDDEEEAEGKSSLSELISLFRTWVELSQGNSIHDSANSKVSLPWAISPASFSPGVYWMWPGK